MHMHFTIYDLQSLNVNPPHTGLHSFPNDLVMHLWKNKPVAKQSSFFGYSCGWRLVWYYVPSVSLGSIHLEKRPGAILHPGMRVATLDLDDPASIRQAVPYTGTFSQLTTRSKGSKDKLNHVSIPVRSFHEAVTLKECVGEAKNSTSMPHVNTKCKKTTLLT